MFWKYNYLGISWAVFILILLGLPGSQFERSAQPNVDIFVHGILFGVLAFQLSVGFLKQSSFKGLRVHTLTKVFVMCVVYGLITEVLQGTIFVGRSVEATDMLFNGVGALAGLSVFGSIYGVKEYL
jgi:VanZ family protein